MRRRISQATACCSAADKRSKESRRCCVAVVMSYIPTHCGIGFRHLCIENLCIPRQLQREVKPILMLKLAPKEMPNARCQPRLEAEPRLPLGSRRSVYARSPALARLSGERELSR